MSFLTQRLSLSRFSSARQGSLRNERTARPRKKSRRAFLEQLEPRQVMAALPGLDTGLVDTGSGSSPLPVKISEFNPHVQAWETAEFGNDTLLVRFADFVTQEDAAATIAVEAPGASIKTWDDGMKFAVLNLPAESTRENVLDLGRQFLRLSNTLYAEPNFVLHYRQTPDDPLYPLQWALDNTGQLAPGPGFPGTITAFRGFDDVDIDAPEAWDLTTGSPEVVIAVLDSGYNKFDPGLQANFWVNPREIYNGIDDDGNGVIDDYHGYDAAMNDGDPQDDAQNGHGLSVASIIASPGNDTNGITGVSWNSKIMTVKIEDDSGEITVGGVIGGYRYVTKMKSIFGINIVAANLSFGGPNYSFSEFEALSQLGNADVLIVAAAANQGYNHDILFDAPTGYDVDQIIAVTASNAYDDLNDFTPPGGYIPGIPDFGYGPVNVDLAAPGINVLVNTFPRPVGMNSFTNVDVSTGTSFAAPHVAGVAALVASLAPGLTALEIKQYIMEGVDQPPQLRNLVKSHGRLNARGALDAIPKNTLSGTVFQDTDGDRIQDFNEPGLAGWQVYLDLDNDSVFDPNEPGGVTDAQGDYSFDAYVVPGTYRLRQVLQPNFTRTTPTTNGGAHVLNLVNRAIDFSDLDFGNRQQAGTITGTKFLDINADGIRDPGEPGLAGIIFYVDMNDNREYNVGEPVTVTDANGNFTIPNVQPGDYSVREMIRAGYLPTFPTTMFGGLPDPVQIVTVTSNTTSSPPQPYGNRIARDYGDLPETLDGLPAYRTLDANGGPSHGILPGFMLGTLQDFEPDGIPSDDARGDDLDPTGSLSDEDGLVSINLVQGSQGAITFVVTNIGRSPGLVQAWIDFDSDGSFDDANEQILRNYRPTNGLNSNIPFTLPANVDPGVKYIRMRYAYEPDLGPNGPAKAGEVEDYQRILFSSSPIGLPDAFTVKQESVGNELDVLVNDPLPSSGVLTIIPGSFPASTGNGTLTLGTNADGQQVLFYTPTGLPNPFTGTDTFTYQVTNNGSTSLTPGTNVSQPITVTVTVTPKDPRAVDDTYSLVGNVPSNTNPQPASFTMNVLANDVVAVPASVLSVVQPVYPTGVTVTGPTVAIAADNLSLIYTPPGGFVGTVQFAYTITDDDGTTLDSSAIVTAQVTNNPALSPTGNPNQTTPFVPANPQYLAIISLEVFDAQGRQLGGPNPSDANFEVRVGEVFYVQAYSEDIRPGGTDDNRGVEAAFLDLLYNRQIVSVNTVPDTRPGQAGNFVPDISWVDRFEMPTPDANYDFDLNAIVGSPEGIINELGGAHNRPQIAPGPPPVFEGPLGKGRKLIASIGFDANAAGTLFFQPDPAEDAGQRSQVLLAPIGFVPDLTTPDPDDGTFFPDPVLASDNEVYLIASDPFNIVSAGGAPEFVNKHEALDVNADKSITAFDALAVLNDLNLYGARDLGEYYLAAAGELPPTFFVDVNGDGMITAFDCLIILNYLNLHPVGGEGGGGGEFTGNDGSGGEAAPAAGNPGSGGEYIAPVDENGDENDEDSSSPVFFAFATTGDREEVDSEAGSTGSGSTTDDNSELLYLTAVDELMTATGGSDDDEVSTTSTDDSPMSNWLNFGNRLRVSLREQLTARWQ